jgi:thiol-disulfide isomerase/thioredoxin
MKRLPSTILLILLLTMATGYAQSLPPGVMSVTPKPAPALQLKDLDGQARDLAASAGHWRFVHFWASWCAPCRREMPAIQAMIPLLKDSGMVFVLVNTAETEDEVFTFVGSVAPDLVPLLDSDGLVTGAWQPRGLPATFLVDPEGRIRYQALGGRAWDKPQYREFLRRLAATPASPAGSR